MWLSAVRTDSDTAAAISRFDNPWATSTAIAEPLVPEAIRSLRQIGGYIRAAVPTAESEESAA